VVKRMLGVTDIANIFGVEPKTVSMWRLRYTDFPEPDISVGDIAGWDPARVKEFQVWESGRPGRGRRAEPPTHVQETLRRVFVYKFMRPDDIAMAPIGVPGVSYDEYDGLSDGMKARATAHLIAAIRSDGYDILFADPTTDVTAFMHRVLWGRWTQDELGEQQFIGRLFDDYGRIYHGCTAFDAAQYTLQRLAAQGGEIRSLHGPG
jgi:hypothetical protein